MRAAATRCWASIGFSLLVFLQPGLGATETLLEKLLRIAGLTAAPSQMRGADDEAAPGDIWIAAVDHHAAKAITTGAGFRSPVFSPSGAVYALRGDSVVRLSVAGGPSVPVGTLTGAAKLVGFADAGGTELIVLLAVARDGSSLGSFSLPKGALSMLPSPGGSEAELRMLAQIRGQERVYGDAKLYLKTESRRGLSQMLEWTDVYFKQGDGVPQNVSGCDGANCSQPALAPDKRSVAFVKTAA